jgi:hypothetical protein
VPATCGAAVAALPAGGKHPLHRIDGGARMLTLAFVSCAFTLFAALLAFETWGDASQPRLRQYGLWHWLVSDNWPAKVGAGLLILGVGALLRYGLVNVAVPPPLKLTAGAGISLALGMASGSLAGYPARRALHLALAGAAFGVAFLTAYSAYGLFGYLTSVGALSALVVVAVTTAAFAVRARSMSVAVLAMTGAFVAPAFSLHDPGPGVVYGYYVAAATMGFVLVTLRGWRALIHLSCLFTLAGGLFFGWTRGYYAPEHFATMLPLLLALAAIHVAMPLADRRSTPTPWSARLDRGYFVLLPIVVAAGLLAIAPTLREHGALALLLGSAVWAAAALAQRLRRQPHARAHALVAAALAAAAALLHFPELPGPLIGMTLSLALLAAAPALGIARVGQTLLASLLLMFGAMHAFDSLWAPFTGSAFLNGAFAERVVAAALLGAGAWCDRRRDVGLQALLGWAGATWLVLAIGAELARLDLDLMWRLLHLALCAAVAGLSLGWRRSAFGAGALIAGALVLVVDGFWVAPRATITWSALLAVASVAALTTVTTSLMSARPTNEDAAVDARDAAAVIVGLLPLALLPWFDQLLALWLGAHRWHALGAVTIAVAGLAIAIGHRVLAGSARWHAVVVPMQVAAIAFALVLSSVVQIERGVWPFLLEFVAVAVLAMVALVRERELRRGEAAYGALAVTGAVLLLQAALLRAFGPEGTLTVFDLRRMGYPALVSLLWAVLGGGLALWSVRIGARSLWSAAAVLLVAAALKLVLLDFGALGELANIVALIAAGLVFLGVAWIAPYPRVVAADAQRGLSSARGNGASDSSVT